MNCPVCGERMREIEKHGIHADICPGCKGYWLDRGELESLLEWAATHGGARGPAVDAPPQPTTRDTSPATSPTQQTPRPEAYRRPDYDSDSDDDFGDRDRSRPGGANYGRGYPKKKKRGWLNELFEGFGD